MKTVSENYELSMQSRCRNRSHIKIVLTSGEILYNFTDKDIKTVTVDSDVDPLSRRVPSETISFSLFDFDGTYNPANPQGKWASLDENAKLTVTFGYESVQGETEWLTSDTYYLDARPTVSAGIATFKASTKLCHLTKTYYKGTYGSHSMYDLAVSVLTDAGISSTEYTIDSSLQEITTVAPIPVTTHLNALQMIAHASCSTLRTSGGVIKIEPFTPGVVSQDLIMGLDAVRKNGDTVSKIETLYKVECDRYTFTKDAEMSVLSSVEYDCDGDPISCHIEYDESADQTISCTGGTISDEHFYANACDFTLTADGFAQVEIQGKKLTVSTSTMEAVASLDTSGSTDSEKNRLITNSTLQSALIYQAVNYLQYRMTHTVTYRGNPELEPLDGLFLKTVYGRYIAGIVLTHSLTFTGSLSGQLMLKSITELRSSYLKDSSGEYVEDNNGQQICTIDMSSYTSAYTAEDIDEFITSILEE